MWLGLYSAVTSTTRWVGADVNTHTAPLGPMAEVPMFATVWPATKLRFEASGRGLSHEYSVRYPASDGLSTVRLSTAAVASLLTPCCPRSEICWTWPAARAVPAPSRVSTRRFGVRPPRSPLPALAL